MTGPVHPRTFPHVLGYAQKQREEPKVEAEFLDVSPELARLIEECDAVRARLNAEIDEVKDHRGLVLLGGETRARVTGFPSRGLPDLLAKAALIARLWSIDEMEAEVRDNVASNYVYLDLMAVGLALELARMAEARS